MSDCLRQSNSTSKKITRWLSQPVSTTTGLFEFLWTLGVGEDSLRSRTTMAPRRLSCLWQMPSTTPTLASAAQWIAAKEASFGSSAMTCWRVPRWQRWSGVDMLGVRLWKKLWNNVISNGAPLRSKRLWPWTRRPRSQSSSESRSRKIPRHRSGPAPSRATAGRQSAWWRAGWPFARPGMTSGDVLGVATSSTSVMSVSPMDRPAKAPATIARAMNRDITPCGWVQLWGDQLCLRGSNLWEMPPLPRLCNRPRHHSLWQLLCGKFCWTYRPQTQHQALWVTSWQQQNQLRGGAAVTSPNFPGLPLSKVVGWS